MVEKLMILCYNKNMKERRFLRVQPIYKILVQLLLVLIFSMPPLMLLLEFNEQINNIWSWVVLIVLVVILVTNIFLFLRYFEWAIVDEQGITIKCFFGNINFLSWKDIVHIKVVKDGLRPSRFNVTGKVVVLLKWITIKTSISEQANLGFNKKKNKVIWITANKKNIEIINLFAKTRLKYK